MSFEAWASAIGFAMTILYGAIIAITRRRADDERRRHEAMTNMLRELEDRVGRLRFMSDRIDENEIRRALGLLMPRSEWDDAKEHGSEWFGGEPPWVIIVKDDGPDGA